MYLAGSCVIAGLSLLGEVLNDVSTLDCQLYRLQQLIASDASEWDDLATACIGPGSLLNSDSCARIPKMHISGRPVYALYNPKIADDYFATIVNMKSCSWFYSDDLACEDVTAMRTLGSERRNRFLNIHKSRTDAANAVRQQRKVAVAVLENTIKKLCEKHDCESVRLLYDIEIQSPKDNTITPSLDILSASSPRLDL